MIRYVCQDIGGSDPERMAAPRVEQYICELFSGTDVNVSIGYSIFDQLEWLSIECQK